MTIGIEAVAAFDNANIAAQHELPVFDAKVTMVEFVKAAPTDEPGTAPNAPALSNWIEPDGPAGTVGGFATTFESAGQVFSDELITCVAPEIVIVAVQTCGPVPTGGGVPGD